MAYNITPYIARVTTTGSAGSASGSTTLKGVKGILARLAINWHASAPATSDLTITEAWDGGSKTIYSKSNAKDDVDFAPLYAAADNAGAAIAGQYATLTLVGGTITVSVAQCDALTDAAIVTLVVVE